MSGKDDARDNQRYQKPYSARHPIPTISKYRHEKEARQEAALNNNSVQSGGSQDKHPGPDIASGFFNYSGGDQQDRGQNDGDGSDDGGLEDTSEVDTGATDRKKTAKALKSKRKERAERDVTDPITHLPVKIHDFTDDALKQVDQNEPSYGSTARTSTDIDAQNKSDEQLQTEKKEVQHDHDFLKYRFPPPQFSALRQELTIITRRGVTVGLVSAVVIVAVALLFDRWMQNHRLTYKGFPLWAALVGVSVAAVWLVIVGVRDWISNRVNSIFEDEVWDAQRRQILEDARRHEPETTAWLNSLLGAVWPLINPDLFAGLADTLEDVMQASLPKVVRMVSVDDIGQGSESLRILGVRWLPTAAAASTVTEDGKLVSGDEEDGEKQKQNAQQDEENQRDDGVDGTQPADGMAAEDGDFVNLEVAFAYRTRSSSKSLKERTKDMHLCLAFYLPGNIKFPVWVDLQGLIGTMRMRLQLTPDPPFFALCTLTFLGQPKVDLSCVPLSKHALNIMDVPLISKFVQSSVDAAMAQYVAPKSLTLDLKDMLAGDDFKKDTIAKGVLMINIKRGYDFKVSDSGIPVIKDGGSDPYVSVGWAKFGKVIWSTRVLVSEMEPCWDETCFLLVTPEEVNIDERLRLQLWDSDRFTADDDLGRIEVNVKDIMRNEESDGRMWHRRDGFRALKSGDNMPGQLEWSVGFFSKTRLQEDQFRSQSFDPQVRTMEQLKARVNESCERKLRETMFKEGQSDRDQSELEQQKSQELKAWQDAMIISAPPPEGYPSGIFSIQIHNITGLELGRLSKEKADKEAEASDEEETGDGLPSSYCTIIINHRKTFKTRTKPQNSKPFFNAGCERFVRDWRDCEVFISVRDSRVHEDDPLLGMVHLPLWDIFKERSQVMGHWPLAGGVGYGKIRLSMVWRSVQLHAPSNLLGWEYGTLEVKPTATSVDCPEHLRDAKLKLRSSLGKGKMYSKSDKLEWQAKKDESLWLPTHKRYSTCVSVAFKTKNKIGDDTAAFCVLWLKDLSDEEEQDVELPIWKGDFKRATSNCLENPGEKLGTLKLRVIFWAGMGSAHSSWANGNEHLKDVVEVIDTARDQKQEGKMEKKAGVVDEDVSSDSSSSSEDEDDGIPDGSAGDKQGPIDRVRDYNKRKKVLHRQHRGVMQWKVPRTAKWMKSKLDKAQGSVTGVFDRNNKGTGIETEA
ncbi:hypothetical protein S7711_04818 [Stachybotrys chartarum IBT 7711]|uniref:C2 domain-containing protein n=1 Tax=Stachybotrys chartarum (strain CBS 109288 / IBT 7711) TaxID=1280523 RepID=A0A084AMG0_STACB|nr:hypothetical protein S7711_04818 [Stachybotrys chartarum IBT 7711]